MRIISKHLVWVLDLEPLRKGAEEYLKTKDMLADDETVMPLVPHGIVEVKGQHFLLNNEGIGQSTPIDSEPTELLWYVRKHDAEGNESGFSLMPTLGQKVTFDKLAPCVTKSRIPLNEFVRTFGSRLDINVSEWNEFFNTLDK